MRRTVFGQRQSGRKNLRRATFHPPRPRADFSHCQERLSDRGWRRQPLQRDKAAGANVAMKISVTFFAPAEREPIEVVHRQASSFSQVPLACTFLNAALNYLFVLNTRRQIVLASENVLELVPGKTMDQIIGLRPGEALGCIHATECESGCGTSRFCHQCGAVRVILLALDGSREMQECHLTRLVKGKEETLDLRVLATPLVHNNERYTLLAMADISREKR
jgi:hypothetical protein